MYVLPYTNTFSCCASTDTQDLIEANIKDN